MIGKRIQLYKKNMKRQEIETDGIHGLTSSISWRETFLLSLLGVDIEAESVAGASVLRFGGWSPWESCETWEADGTSCVFCKSHIWSCHSNENQYQHKQ